MGLFDVKIPKVKTSSLRGATPRKRDIDRANTMRRIREPISAKLKKQVLARAKNTCEHKGCRIKNSQIKLQFHHKNMNNDDNRPSNILALCPNHHWLKHKNQKKIVERDIIGREIRSKVVSHKRAKQIKKAKKDPFNVFGGYDGRFYN